MNSIPRVALFCETFHEINGVALTARQLVAYAQRHQFPFLSVRPGSDRAQFQDGSISSIELPRGLASFGIERDLRYDLFFWRHFQFLRRALEQFRPDAIHCTSPGEFGQLGALLAHSLGVPLVASWHTNLHQYAGRRLAKLLSFTWPSLARSAHHWAERNSLQLILRFYRIARVTLAPTPQQVRWLEDATGKPCFLMPRGVDCEEFHPRFRSVSDHTVRLGFVGRVTPEKGVRLLAEIDRALVAAGHHDFSILVVGDGSEREWLRAHMRHGDFRGVLRGRDLATAFADMDLFVFPSCTDTFGNVIQEAAASGVSSVVTSEGGPQNLVVPAITGYIAETDQQFVRTVVELANDRARLRRLGQAAREHVLGVSWDAAFQMTYAAYRHCLQPSHLAKSPKPSKRPSFPAVPRLPAASL
jgi:glycosyltransferase involved in cell wall biosynthesis